MRSEVAGAGRDVDTVLVSSRIVVDKVVVGDGAVPVVRLSLAVVDVAETFREELLA